MGKAWKQPQALDVVYTEQQNDRNTAWKQDEC